MTVPIRRIAAPAIVAAALSSGVAVAVNMATEGGTTAWAWAAVVVLTVLVAATTLWTERVRGQRPTGSVVQRVQGSSAGGDLIQARGHRVRPDDDVEGTPADLDQSVVDSRIRGRIIQTGGDVR